MTYQIAVDERITIPATAYAIGRMTYVVNDTCTAIRDVWPHLSEAVRARLRGVLDASLTRASLTCRTLGMDFDHTQWVSLATWMCEHADDPHGDGSAITLDEGMLVSALRESLRATTNDDVGKIVRDTVKESWGQLSPNYRDVITRDIADDLAMFKRAPEIAPGRGELAAWADLLAWCRARPNGETFTAGAIWRGACDNCDSVFSVEVISGTTQSVSRDGERCPVCEMFDETGAIREVIDNPAPVL